MKIAIQGHPTRGKEVIQILENLGGINSACLYGDGTLKYYSICNDNKIRCDVFKDYKHYTLEEFEKEFPFKIGEVVFTTVHSTTFKGVVKNINFNDTIYPYDCSFEDSGKCSLGGMNVLVKCETNQLFKMKEERNITLTLDKAKEWYNKGGELKEIALQAFSEKELNPLPRSWEEYNRRYASCCFSTRYTNIPLKYDALLKLEQLRDCWRQGWELDWNDVNQAKYYVCYYQGRFKISTLYETRRFLSFPTREMAEEFLACFKDLIEQAGDLI